MPFLYGNHVVKAHLGRITEDTPEHQGVVVFNMNDVPLVRTMPLSIPSRSSYGLVHFIGHHCGFHPMIVVSLLIFNFAVCLRWCRDLALPLAPLLTLENSTLRR